MQSPNNRQLIVTPLEPLLINIHRRLQSSVSLECKCSRCEAILRREDPRQTVVCRCKWVWKGKDFVNRNERRAIERAKSKPIISVSRRCIAIKRQFSQQSPLWPGEQK